MQRQGAVVAGRPAHGWQWQADIRSDLRCSLERPLSEAQLTMDRGWEGHCLNGCFPAVRTRSADQGGHRFGVT